MKIKLLLLIIFTSYSVFSQQKTEKYYYDEEGKKTDSTHAVSTSHYIFTDTIQGSGVTKEYNMQGKLIRETNYANMNIKSSSIKMWTKEGTSKYYHKNGTVKIIEFYKNNKLDGELLTYYTNKKLKRKDVFKEDQFVSGQCFDVNSNEIEHFNYFIHPEYAGGDSAIYKFISKNLRYPESMQEMGVQGKVIVRFKVTKDAKLKNLKVVKSPSQALSKEAIRVVSLLKDWKPGQRDGEKIDVNYALPISFKLQ